MPQELAGCPFLSIVPAGYDLSKDDFMRIVGLAFTVLFLMSGFVFAQEAVDCSSEAIETRVDAAYDAYAEARGDDELAALSDLNAELEAILTACGTSAAEATAESTAEVADGTVSAASLVEGKWEVQWSRTGRTACPGQGGTSASNRYFMLTTDAANDSFTADDILVWPPLVFTASIDGGYQFLRNIALNDGSVVSYDYRVNLISNERIEGTSTFFDPEINCALENSFVMILADENIICMIASDTGANLRSGAGTDFQRNGSLPAGERTDVIGQAEGSDGFVWWQLASEAWVRSDLVEEAGRCDELPVIE
jgi:hypothetical protein